MKKIFKGFAIMLIFTSFASGVQAAPLDLRFIQDAKIKEMVCSILPPSEEVIEDLTTYDNPKHEQSIPKLTVDVDHLSFSICTFDNTNILASFVDSEGNIYFHTVIICKLKAPRTSVAEQLAAITNIDKFKQTFELNVGPSRMLGLDESAEFIESYKVNSQEIYYWNPETLKLSSTPQAGYNEILAYITVGDDC